MSVSAKIVLPWKLVSHDPETEFQTITKGSQVQLQRRKHYILQLTRRAFQVVGYTEDVDKTATAFRYETSSETAVNYSSSRKYVCTRNPLKVIEFILGECQEDQTWEHFTDWEDVPAGTFT